MGSAPGWRRRALALLLCAPASEAIRTSQQSRQTVAVGKGEEHGGAPHVVKPPKVSSQFTDACQRYFDEETLKKSTFTSERDHDRPWINPSLPAMLYFLHIPKAAGGSFDLDVQQLITPSGPIVTYISKEGCFEWSRCMDRAGTVTFLRNPRAHVYSQYTHCTSLPTRPEKLRDGMPSFEAWLRLWIYTRKEGEANTDYTPFLTKEQKPISTTQTRSPFKCYSPIDLQTHRLACHKTFDYGGGKNKLATARGSVRSLWMVGIVEAYPESMCLLFSKMYDYLPASCDCTNTTDGRIRPPFATQHRAHGVKSHGVEDLDQETLGYIDSLTADDLAIYKEGVKRFWGDIHAAEAKHGVKVICNATHARLQPFLK